MAVTDKQSGAPLNTPPFAGEMMRCVMCGRQQRSDPKAESQWRSIDVDGVRYYACPFEFPKDGAPKQKFEKAYKKIVLKISRLRRSGD